MESTQAAFEAGASVVHAHVRNEDQTPSSDPEKFARLKEGLEKHCPGMIIQFSTGGRSGSGRERGGMLPLKPDMASLSVGSNNFPNRVYQNSPDLVEWLAGQMHVHGVKPEIEAFDLSHIHQAAKLWREGKIKDVPYIQFVMGVKNAMPADRDVFDYYVKTVERLVPGGHWCADGIGSAQIVMNEWSVSAGGHERTGLKDNVRLDKQALALSNAALVQRVVEMCERYKRPIASWRQARDMLNLAHPDGLECELR